MRISTLLSPLLFTLLAGVVTPSAAQDGGPDAGVNDAGATDAGVQDGGPTDGGHDAGIEDAGLEDAGLEDAGTEDAGVDECGYRCEGDTLIFCDDGQEVSLDCQLEGARCGLLDDEWGNDCLLPVDAACSPGYAEARSRCDPDANITCVVDVCAACPDATCAPVFPAAPTPPATSGDVPTVPGDDADVFSCLGCTDTPTLPFLSLIVFVAGIRLRRRSNRIR